jgi:hypothetical protein
MTAVDLQLLTAELEAGGVPVPNGLTTPDGTLESVMMYDPQMEPAPLPPEAAPILAAHDASKGQRAVAFEAAEDAERLRVINERARTDPAFAALAELVLKGKGT